MLAKLYVKHALRYGASPYQIAETLGLTPEVSLKMHPLQERLLKARETKLISQDESYYSIARKLGVKNHGTIYHHINRLKVLDKW